MYFLYSPYSLHSLSAPLHLYLILHSSVQPHYSPLFHLLLFLFLAISAATCATWLRQNDRGLFHTVWNTPGSTFIFPVGVVTMAGTEPLGQARRCASTHFRLCSNLIRGRPFHLFLFSWQEVDECLQKN